MARSQARLWLVLDKRRRPLIDSDAGSDDTAWAEVV
jgi:hypothetical protein